MLHAAFFCAAQESLQKPTIPARQGNPGRVSWARLRHGFETTSRLWKCGWGQLIKIIRHQE
jgi:hypothetical protein